MADDKTCTMARLTNAINFHNERKLAIKVGYKQKIEDHNQFNLYTREFLADNPELSRDDVNRCWAAIIEIPRPESKGRGIRYSKDDLKHLK